MSKGVVRFWFRAELALPIDLIEEELCIDWADVESCRVDSGDLVVVLKSGEEVKTDIMLSDIAIETSSEKTHIQLMKGDK